MQLQVSPLFGAGAVIQSGQTFPVWGNAPAGTQVSVWIDNATSQQTQADSSGVWRVTLPACKAGGPYALHVASGNENIENQIYAGEVFVLAGQSNMEFEMANLHWRYPTEFSLAPDPLLRHCKIPVYFNFHEPQTSFQEPISWKGAQSDTLDEFSGIGYFFGKTLRRMLDVPVGLLNITLGGSPVESWMDEESLSKWPDALEALRPYLDDSYAQNRIESTVAAGKAWYDSLQLEKSDAVALADARNALSSLPQALSWQPIELPNFLKHEDPKFASFKGSLYLRRTFSVPRYAQGKAAELHLGAMVDSDTTWINGVAVGNSEHQYLSRDYSVPQDVLEAGINTIVVRLVSEHGNARVTPGKRMHIDIGDDCINLAGSWQVAVGHAAESECPVEDFVRWKPLGLYNSMVAPCAGYPVKAVLWYQGESNTGDTAGTYAARLTDMIASWRRAWGQKRLPFLLVQLPEFSIDGVEDGGWPTVRDQLRQVSAKMPDVGLAIALGAGEWNDLHPLNKSLVADRLIVQAQRVIYDDCDAEDNPYIISAHYDELGTSIVVTVSNGRNDLQLTTMDGADPGEFVVEWADGSCSLLEAKVTSSTTVSIKAPYRKAVRVRYAWRNAPSRGLLCSKSGIPVSPAIIDIEH